MWSSRRRRRIWRRWGIAAALATLGPSLPGAVPPIERPGTWNTFADASAPAGEPVRVVQFAVDRAGADPSWQQPGRRAAFRIEGLPHLRDPRLARAGVLLLDTGGEKLQRQPAENLLAGVRAGLRLVVHDPGGQNSELLLDAEVPRLLDGSGAFRDRNPRSGHGWVVTEQARRTLLQQGPGGLLDDAPATDFATHFGLMDPTLPLESALVPLLVEPEAGLLAVCQPEGEGAVVYSLIDLPAFLRGRQDSPSGRVLREIYAPNLVAWAAWGACNPETAALPIPLDVLPEDPDNRLRRRGVRVALLSSALVDSPSQIDRESIRFGKSGSENSLYRCAERVRDVDRDGRADLTCVFLFERTGLTRDDVRARLTARTHQGTALRGIDAIRFYRSS